MEIQKFYLEELTELMHDNEKLDEWRNTVAELKLEGQKKVNNKNPIPFTFMNNAIHNIFDTLTPMQKDINDYNVNPIPLEVLRMIKLCEEEKYFNAMQIWYADKDPDPILVGLKGYWYEAPYYEDTNKELKNIEFNTREEVIDAGGKHPNFLSRQKYLLARWGDEAKTLVELKKEAIIVYTKRKTAELNKRIKETNYELETLEETVVERFG
jgi:hypothetical protein